MRLRSRRGWAGPRLERSRFLGTALLHLLDLDEVANLPEHTGELRAFCVFGRASDLAKAERAKGPTVAHVLANAAARLGDLELHSALSSGASAAGASATAVGSASVSSP